MATRRTKLERPLFEYNPRTLAKISENDLRKEYARLYSVAQKRIKRLAKSEFSNTEFYTLNVNRFRPTKSIKRGTAEIKYALMDIARFIVAETSTVSGIRRMQSKTIKSLRESGINVTHATLADYGAMMEYLRAIGYDRLFYKDSGTKRGRSPIDANIFNELFSVWQNADDKESAVKESVKEYARMEGVHI